MKQRIAIAQAILHEPLIVILDEPTSGLDPRGMFEVREMLVELKRRDYTVFMSSHLLNEVQDVCEEVALINRGKLLKSGPVQELISSNDVRRLEIRVKQRIAPEVLDRVSKLANVSGPGDRRRQCHGPLREGWRRRAIRASQGDTGIELGRHLFQRVRGSA